MVRKGKKKAIYKPTHPAPLPSLPPTIKIFSFFQSPLLLVFDIFSNHSYYSTPPVY